MVELMITITAVTALLIFSGLNYYFHIYRSYKIYGMVMTLLKYEFGLYFKLPGHNKMLYSFKPIKIESWVDGDVLLDFRIELAKNPHYVDYDGPEDMYRLNFEKDLLESNVLDGTTDINEDDYKTKYPEGYCL